MIKHIPSRPADQSEQTPWTPGPWRRDTRAIVCRQIFAGPKDKPVSVAVVSTDTAAWEANARLIALAPRIAEALKSFVTDYPIHADDCSCRWCAARAILAELERG